MVRSLIRAGAFALLALLVFRAGPAEAGELVLVERRGCAYCEKWASEVAPVYTMTDEGRRLPLRRVDLADGQPSGAATPVRYTPTFLVMDGRHEVGRITGYMNDAMFWGMLSAIAARLP
jgi:thioredoxin-related protein